MIRIAHLYPKYHRNVGDHFVQRGILRLLRPYCGDFEYTPLPTRLLGPDPSEALGITAGSVDLLNRHDLVVIGGSNLYETMGDRWGVEVESAALRRLTAPVLLLGIGGGWSFAFPTFPRFPPKIAEHVAELHARARGSSVRDHMSQRLLAGHGIGPSVVTGCPATFLASEPPRPPRGGVVGLPFLPRRMYAEPSLDPRQWKNPTYRRRRDASRIFRALLEELPKAGYEVRILVHDANDLDLAREMLGTKFFWSEEPEKLFAAIAECDAIVGFRLHAAIAALGLGIPVIPILLDGRNAAFVETFGLTEYAVPVDPAAAVLVLQRLALAMGSSRSVWNPVFARRDELRDAMHDFLRSALSSSRAAAR